MPFLSARRGGDLSRTTHPPSEGGVASSAQTHSTFGLDVSPFRAVWAGPPFDRKQTMKVAILAGGTGSRLSEETVDKPKPMVEVGGRPILWHIMKYYAE